MMNLGLRCLGPDIWQIFGRSLARGGGGCRIKVLCSSSLGLYLWQVFGISLVRVGGGWKMMNLGSRSLGQVI